MASTIIFEAGSTTTITNFAFSGTAGNVVTIKSSQPGIQFTLTKASGTVTANYLSIRDSNATGGAYWDATDETNFNFGNNTGWEFTVMPVTGEFFAFF